MSNYTGGMQNEVSGSIIRSYADISSERSSASVNRMWRDRRCYPAGTTYRAPPRHRGTTPCDSLLFRNTGTDGNMCCSETEHACMHNILVAWKIIREITGHEFAVQSDMLHILYFLLMISRNGNQYQLQNVSPRDGEPATVFQTAINPQLTTAQLLLERNFLRRIFYVTGAGAENCDRMLCQTLSLLPNVQEPHVVFDFDVHIGRSWVPDPEYNIFQTLSFFRFVQYTVQDQPDFMVPTIAKIHESNHVAICPIGTTSLILQPQTWCEELYIYSTALTEIKWSQQFPDAGSFLGGWIRNGLERLSVENLPLRQIWLSVDNTNSGLCVCNLENLTPAINAAVPEFDMIISEDWHIEDGIGDSRFESRFTFRGKNFEFVFFTDINDNDSINLKLFLIIEGEEL